MILFDILLLHPYFYEYSIITFLFLYLIYLITVDLLYYY